MDPETTTPAPEVAPDPPAYDMTAPADPSPAEVPEGEDLAGEIDPDEAAKIIAEALAAHAEQTEADRIRQLEADLRDATAGDLTYALTFAAKDLISIQLGAVGLMAQAVVSAAARYRAATTK